MRTVYSSEGIREAERAHARELVNGTLMQRAAFGLANRIIAIMGDRCGRVVGQRVVVLAGSGNNGGDALFAGARLAERGAKVCAILVGDRHHEDAGTALMRAGGTIITPLEAEEALCEAQVVLDGILGIGARGSLGEPVLRLLEIANEVGAVRVAVDIPTGVHAETGEVAAAAFKADFTVTFAAEKPGLLTGPGKDCAGRVDVVDIGIGTSLGNPVARVCERADAAGWLPAPGFDDHKYRRGVAGVAAGSRAYRGAALLCVGASLTGPTGMTAVLDRGDGVAELVIGQHPEVVRLDQPVSHVTAWACGPGFTGSDDDRDTVEALLRTDEPVILDAGAITVLAGSEHLRTLVRTRAGATVLTPHEGEFLRLGGTFGSGRMAAAAELARSLDSVIILKGPGSIIAAPDGTCFIDEAGTPDLATAGSGDVLAGCLTTLMASAQARGALGSIEDTVAVAAAGCWLHGMAGRRAAGFGFATATGIVNALAQVVGEVTEVGRSPMKGDNWGMGYRSFDAR